MKNTKLTLLRLQKQQAKLEEDPIQNVLVTRKGLLNFHFCIYALDAPYKSGYYHGVLELHEDYPFSPPKLIFYTPSGRFQPGKPICTSFTNFHKETWTSAWNVRTMITATISFMTSEQAGLGGLHDNYFTRQRYAQQSLSWNMKNRQFCQLFKQKLLKNNVTISQNFSKTTKDSQNSQKQKVQSMVTSDNKLYLLYFALLVLIFLWHFIRTN